MACEPTDADMSPKGWVRGPAARQGAKFQAGSVRADPHPPPQTSAAFPFRGEARIGVYRGISDSSSAQRA